MTMGVELRFTSALGVRPPWAALDARLDVALGRIDVDVACDGATLACPACGTGSQPVLGRQRRSWRHLNLGDLETWLHCDVPRVACGVCGRPTDVQVPWARTGSGYSAAFEALAFELCLDGPVAQVASLLRCTDTRLVGTVAFHASQAREGRRAASAQSHGLDEPRPSQAEPGGGEGRGQASLDAFIAALKARGGDPERMRRSWMGANAAQASNGRALKGLTLALTQARTAEERLRALDRAMNSVVAEFEVPSRASAPAARAAAPQTPRPQTVVQRVKAAPGEVRAAAHSLGESVGRAFLRAFRLTRGPANPLALANATGLWGRQGMRMRSLAMMLLIPILASAAVQNWTYFGGGERTRGEDAGPPWQGAAGRAIGPLPAWFYTQETDGNDSWAGVRHDVPGWRTFAGGLDVGWDSEWRSGNRSWAAWDNWGPSNSLLSSAPDIAGEWRGSDAFWRDRNAWSNALLGPFGPGLGSAQRGGSQDSRSFTALGTNGTASAASGVGVTAPVPEPGTFALALAGVAMLALSSGLRRRVLQH